MSRYPIPACLSVFVPTAVVSDFAKMPDLAQSVMYNIVYCIDAPSGNAMRLAATVDNSHSPTASWKPSYPLGESRFENLMYRSSHRHAPLESPAGSCADSGNSCITPGIGTAFPDLLAIDAGLSRSYLGLCRERLSKARAMASLPPSWPYSLKPSS